MNQYTNPTWWNIEHDFLWGHIKLVMKREWERMRTKAALPQNQPGFEEVETACRFGYGARLEYETCYAEWNDDLEIKLNREWETMNASGLANWEQVRTAVHYGWYYEDEHATEGGSVLTGESIKSSGCR